MAKEVLVGHIANYIYTSTDSLYKVCKLITNDDDEVIIVGSFPMLEDGLDYEFVGEMKNHPKYGEQFFVSSYSKSKSFTRNGLISYLSSDKFFGIGERLATYIVDELGLDCINTILKYPDSLDKVYGITKKKKETIVSTLKDNYASEQVFIKLYSFGLTPKMIQKLYDAYQDKAANKIEEDPYCLISEVEGFGFKKCDNLALNLGFKLNDIRRVSASILYTLNTVCYQQGFTYLTLEQLFNSSKTLLNNNIEISDLDYQNAFDDLVTKKKVYVEGQRVFEPHLQQAELKCAEKILKMSKTKAKSFNDDKVKRCIDEVEALFEIKYTPLQREAIFNALTNKLSIITGGPGTGKSTILNGILNIYAKLNDLAVTDDDMSALVLLAAPTGRASKRMTETTNFKASTIHKALGYSPDSNKFQYNELSTMPYSLIIIDESSMMDVELASSLFKAISNTARVILVGDVNQLPSVGPGNVLADLIASNIFKVTTLNQIMRQANDSNIIKLSHMILNENISYNIFSEKKEVFYYNFDTKDIINGIFKIMDNYLQKGGDLYSKIQILAPMYAGVCGIDAINKAIQERYNPETEKILKRENVLFKKNDKVLQLKNDSELDIMNGDIGKIVDIVKIDNKDSLLIDFDGRIVTYSASLIDNLKLAYAISIHKSQGSEFENVIMPISSSYQIMLKKRIIYTGVTRAKKKLIFLGKLEALESAIHQGDYQRQTALYQYLNASNNVSIDNKIFDPTIPFDTLGEYDMDGITPYSFM